MSQELWSDAIYTRRFTRFKTLEADALLKIALIARFLQLIRPRSPGASACR